MQRNWTYNPSFSLSRYCSFIVSAKSAKSVRLVISSMPNVVVVYQVGQITYMRAISIWVHEGTMESIVPINQCLDDIAD